MIAAWLCVSAMSAAYVLSRRSVWVLGRMGPALAPAVLLVLWIFGVRTGEFMGSLTAMAVGGALPLILIAVWSRKTARRKTDSYRWTPEDWAAFGIGAALFFSYVGHDALCHYDVIGQYLRGNIPPSALNDPTRALPYHALFDAGASLFAAALPVTPNGAMSCFSTLCLAAVLWALQGLSRVLFRPGLSRQAARLLFLYGFGPVYLRLPFGLKQFGALHFMHGQTTQSFFEASLRRPMGLNFVIFLILAAVVLPRLKSHAAPGAAEASALPASILILCGLLVPLAGEELAVLGSGFIAYAACLRRLKMRWLCAWLIALAFASLISGVARSIGAPTAGVLAPHPALHWPPRLPHSEFWMEGVPLLSSAAAGSLLCEFGPFFFAALYWAWGDERRRAWVVVVAVGAAVACLFTLGRWPQADVDRFLFYGTPAGFMLAAAVYEKLNQRWATALVLLSFVGPAGYAADHLVRALHGRPAERLPSTDVTTGLRAALKAVGPREPVLTDAVHVQALAYAGFIVAAPMTSYSIGFVTLDDSGSYSRDPARPRPRWLLLAPGHPLLHGAVAEGEFGGCILARPTDAVSDEAVAALLDPKTLRFTHEAWPPCLISYTSGR